MGTPSYENAKLMVAHLTTGSEAGVTFEDWPLHVTLLPWCIVAEDWGREVFRRSTADMRACRVVLGARRLGPVALFGEAENIPVRPIGDSTALGVAHGLLLAQFHPYIAEKSWIGSNYNPHVTVRDNPDPGEGYALEIDTLSMVRHDGDHKTVIETVALRHETAA